MMNRNELEILKPVFQEELNLYPNGVIYSYVENGISVWSLKSPQCTLEAFDEGSKIQEDLYENAIRQEQILTELIPSTFYGQVLKITTIPVSNEEKEIHGILFIIVPKIHPMLQAFPFFSSVITDMFPSGAFLSITDTEKTLAVQDSDKFSIETVKIGSPLTDNPLILDAITKKETVTIDDDSNTVAPPFRFMVAPYKDEETDEILGTLAVVRPRKTENDLRNMSLNLETNLEEVAKSIEQLSSAAELIHRNEQDLNSSIQDITVLSNQIAEISDLIKSIADQTKMLGLNASIEAARAGEAGKGFSVVAQEIRKLSEDSKNTVPKIKKLTDDIKEKVQASVTKSTASLSSSQEQAAATQEITATIEEIQATSEELSHIAENL